MAYKFYNPNPVGRMTNDCSVRALSKALGVTWDEAYLKLAYNGKQMGVMPSQRFRSSLLNSRSKSQTL